MRDFSSLLLLLLLQVHDQMVEIFDNPDTVMTKFVQVVIDRVLQVGHLFRRTTYFVNHNSFCPL